MALIMIKISPQLRLTSDSNWGGGGSFNHVQNYNGTVSLLLPHQLLFRNSMYLMTSRVMRPVHASTVNPKAQRYPVCTVKEIFGN